MASNSGASEATRVSAGADGGVGQLARGVQAQDLLAAVQPTGKALGKEARLGRRLDRGPAHQAAGRRRRASRKRARAPRRRRRRRPRRRCSRASQGAITFAAGTGRRARAVFALDELEDRHRRLARDARRATGDVFVEHQVADDQDAPAGESSDVSSRAPGSPRAHPRQQRADPQAEQQEAPIDWIESDDERRRCAMTIGRPWNA